MSDRLSDRTVDAVMRRVLLSLLALAAAVALVFGVSGLAFGHTEEHEHIVRGTVTRIAVEGGSGDVSLLGAGVRDITIHERKRYGWRSPRLVIERTGTELRVAVHCRSWSGRCADDLDIVVPRSVSFADVRTGSGDISLAGLTAGHFAASSRTGDVRATRVTGALALHSASGDVARR
jgi:hypothetical protein